MTVVLATAAATVGVGAAGMAAAAADGPTVAITPDHVVDGQIVGIDISGFPDTPANAASVVVECSGAVVAAPEEAPSLCFVQTLLNFAPGPLPAHSQLTAVVSFSTFRGGRRVDCRAEPDGCVAGVVTATDPLGSATVVAYAFDGMVFVNALSGAPSRRLSDGDVVTVTGRDVEPGEWSVAQCGRALLDDPTPGQVAALCGAAQPVTLDADGSFTADMVVHDPLTSAGGDAVACGGSGCVVVLTSAAAPVGASFGISFGPVTLTADPDHDLADGATVIVTVTGATPGLLRLYQCGTPVGATVSASRCVLDISVPIDDSGSLSGPVIVRATLPDAGDPPIDCRTATCVFAVFDSDGQLVAQTGPLGFRPPPAMTLSPATGLLEGRVMTVAAENLVSNGTYRVQRCTPRFCDDGQTVTAGADGTLTTTVPASQRLQLGSTYGYCRADCHVTVLSFSGGNPPEAPYTMAAGSLAAAPDTGLSDGRTIDVTGTDLMPTYAGPFFWVFPTGGWSLTQCDRAIVDQPTLGGALTHCGAAPVTRAVTVDGSTLDAPLDVQATLTKIIGGTTDCTAAPGACVVGLVRLEQDGSLSTHLTPIAFG